MVTCASPQQGIRYSFDGGWEVFSPLLQFPIHCGSPKDAKRVAKAIEATYPHAGAIDYSEVNAAIAKECALSVFSR